METKICNKCNEKRPIAKFPLEKWKLKDGTLTYYRCSPCNSCRVVVKSPEQKKLDRIKYAITIKASKNAWRKHGSENLTNSYIKDLLYKCKKKVTIKAINDKKIEVIKRRADKLNNLKFLSNTPHFCLKCKETKPAKEFPIIKYSTKSGIIKKLRSSPCKKCTGIISKKFEKYQRITLSDNYIKKTIIGKSILRHSDIPQEFIELKRKELQFNRKLKQLNII
jgi:hypothetical protein